MSKPTGDSLLPGENGFWVCSPLPALAGVLFLLILITLASASLTLAAPVPRIIPPDAKSQAQSPHLKGLISADESSQTGRWIVAGSPGAQTERQARQFGAVGISHPLGMYVLDETSATDFIIALRKRGAYRYSEPDVPTVPDPGGMDGARGADTDQWWLDEICPIQCRPPNVTSRSPTVALLEESLNPAHPDLVQLKTKNRLLGAIRPLGAERDSRGTAMAALAASPSTDRDGQVTGVWPGMRVRLVSSKRSCAGKTRAVYEAAERRRNNRVLAMGYSFPRGERCYSHYLATEYAVYRGLIPVAAAGNANYTDTDPSPPQPASDRHVLTVSASNQEGQVWNGAIGGPWVDLTAPGEGLRVAGLRPEGDGQQSPWDWGVGTGTEYSATIVAAAAAWLLQKRPDLKARQIIRLLTNTATGTGSSGWSPESGHGQLNLSGALKAKGPVNDPFEPNDDIGWVTHRRSKSLLHTGPSINDERVKRKPFWRPTEGKREVVATLGRVNDPADVYRIRVAPRSKVLITVTANGYTDLVGIRSDATSITELKKSQKLVELIDREKKKTYAMLVKNRSGLSRTAFVAIGVSAKQAAKDFSYRLSVKPRR